MIVIIHPLSAQNIETNYDESKVPAHRLPALLRNSDGAKITTAEEWVKNRRPEILHLFEKFVYGKSPDTPANLAFSLVEQDTNALDGRAVRKQVAIYLGDPNNPLRMNVLIYLPRNAQKSHPLFLAMNFYGNHTINDDPIILLPKSWVRNNEQLGITANQATENTRGIRSDRWPVEKILQRGYGLATLYYGDVDPDFDDGFQNGVHRLYNNELQTKPAADEWGSIAAWAWGLSRVMDYCEKDEDIDHKHVVVMGHSRLGKTALWAGATDDRFALVISNNSGCGGAALSRRRFGETVKKINTNFPHWFCENFKNFNDKEDELPINQHMLIALIAPRPVYIASAEEDRWADPKGEFLSAMRASAVYELFGQEGLPVKYMPAINTPITGTIGYHMRTGKHGVTDFDWQNYLDFADGHFNK
ncbi:MAG: acetylxylan esterase [Deferribacteres bacterium]|nr:acetylxylan esterase [candidate division KSB1 bacterium]MCB9503637.1 acetylxylan esterase [Deferribacteres bacterium]